MRTAGRGWWGVTVAVLVLWAAVVAGPACAGTTGKISGRVLDPGKQPLAGANIAIPAARTGAVSDADGRFTILNLPPGEYEVRVSLIGYRNTTVQNVRVSADNTTRLDVNLQIEALQLEEVVVDARRPVVDLGVTSNMAAIQREEISQLPVQELQEIVNLQAGVVSSSGDLHFRGGRVGEVQFQVDGVSVNNAFDNRSSLRLDRSLLEEVQVISGTFDAEYGQAMSGVVNAVLRRGTDRLRWDAELLGGSFLFDGGPRNVDDTFRAAQNQSYQLSVSGPAPLPRTFFLVNARRGIFQDYVYGTRRFVPTDNSDRGDNVFRPTGDGEKVPLGFSREWSGVVKLTNRSIPSVEVNYQAILNKSESRPLGWAFRVLPDGRTWQHRYSVVHGLDWTHSLGPKTYYNVNLRQNYLNYRDHAYDDFYSALYDSAGPLRSDDDYERGAFIQGVSLGRFQQTTDAWIVKSSFVSQVTRDQQIKLGAELQRPELSFGAPGTILEAGDGITRRIDQPPLFPSIQRYRPLIAAAFVQDELEWNDLRIRAGLRYEYFDANASLPSDLANPANDIVGAPASPLREVSAKSSLAPRIGVSYPVGTNAAVFFAYGHFYQMPALNDLFSNADYRTLSGLQARTSFAAMGNPDVRPERSVQYQFGYRQALTEWLGLDLNAYYKDIRDLLGTEFVATYNDAEYARLTNVDFGNVIGFTLALDQRALGLLSTSFDYTWQLAQGNSSDPREIANAAAAGLDARPQKVPLNWDQRHTFNTTIQLARPDAWSASAVVRVVSGQPYTPETAAGFEFGLERNSGRKPNGAIVDLRAEKRLKLAGLPASLFGRVFNLFDARFFNGFVFPNSGSPYYSREDVRDEVTLGDPTRFQAPRRIEVGLSLRSVQ